MVNNANQEQPRSADQERARSIVQYLLARLRQHCPVTITQNELTRHLYSETEAAGTRNSRYRSLLEVKKLTTAELVELIGRINKAVLLINQMNPSEELPAVQFLAPEEILMLLQQLVQLKPEEKQRLNILKGAEETLLQQALLNMRLYQSPQDYERVLNFYCASINLTDSPETTEFSLEELRHQISQILASHTRYLPSVSTNFTQDVINTVCREINKILVKSGTQQSQFWNAQSRTTYIRRYLTSGFVKRLTQAIAENKLLLEDFPIHITKIVVEDKGTLPLSAVTSNANIRGLLNQDLLNLDPEEKSDLSSLAIQSAIGVTIHFSLRKKIGTAANFKLSSSGIGGTLSQIVKVINTALLGDIDCLRDQKNGRNFFPIAHDVMVNQKIIQNNISSPVWAHSLVRLCQADVLAQAMTESIREGEICFYDQVAFGDSIGRGDYCDFDFLQTIAKGALYARLRAIKHTGVLPSTYLDDLRTRINYKRLIEEAHSHVVSYPFSSLAQEGWLRDLLTKYQYPETLASAPEAVFNAYLLTIETFLQEGMYRRAYGYLYHLKTVLEPLVNQALTWYEQINNSQPRTESILFKNFSGALLVRYQLCWATYYYLLDRRVERDNPDYLGDLPVGADDRSIIREAWDAVNKSEQLATVRLAKYLVINEISQGTFHPHYTLLAQIFFLKLRLLLFFPRVVPIDRQTLPTDVPVVGNRRDVNAIYGGWLYLLEKARLYASCSGSQELYSCYTAFQSCIYIIVSLEEQEVRLVQNDRETQLSPQVCLSWARRLRDHALLSYAKTGRHCYYQIKEKSGISRSLSRSYGRYSIEEIPPIREMRHQDGEKPGMHKNDLLYIDMELLSIRGDLGQNDEEGDLKGQIYLFGHNACYAMFSRGLYHLCSDDRLEFQAASPLETAQQWDQKFAQSYSLFTYAWAMAEDGGTLRQSEEEGQIRIERDFTVSGDTMSASSIGAEESTAAYAKSVQDLYPCRVTEIADLAKIFMSVTALLRLYVDVEGADQLRDDITAPLSKLHGEQRCQESVMSAVLEGQSQYNGHLETFFSRCNRGLEKEIRQIQPLSAGNLSDIKIHRKRILKTIFDGLYQDNS